MLRRTLSSGHSNCVQTESQRSAGESKQGHLHLTQADVDELRILLTELPRAESCRQKRSAPNCDVSASTSPTLAGTVVRGPGMAPARTRRVARARSGGVRARSERGLKRPQCGRDFAISAFIRRDCGLVGVCRGQGGWERPAGAGLFRSLSGCRGNADSFDDGVGELADSGSDTVGSLVAVVDDGVAAPDLRGPPPVE